MVSLNPFFRSYLGELPSDATGGPRMIRPTATLVAGADPINGSAGARADIDLTQDAVLGNILFLQALYLDLADIAATNSISVICVETGFRVTAKGKTQGWYPFICANTMRITVTAPTGLIGTALPLILTNTPADAMQWATA